MATLHFLVEPKLELRLPEVEDAPEMFAIFSEDREHLAEWQDWPNKIHLLEDCENYILTYRQSYAANSAVPLVILFHGTPIGLCELSIKSHVVRDAELSYWIAEKHQGKGLMTKSCRALLKHAFSDLNLNRAFLRFKHVSQERENSRSRRMAERLGFIEEGVQRQGGMT